MNIIRENTREIKIGNRTIGGKHPVLIQSMTNTKTEDVKATVEQIFTNTSVETFSLRPILAMTFVLSPAAARRSFLYISLSIRSFHNFL